MFTPIQKISPNPDDEENESLFMDYSVKRLNIDESNSNKDHPIC